MDFVLNLILKSNTDNIDDLSSQKRYDLFNRINISYAPIKAISKEELLLHKLFNEKYKYFDITINVSIESINIYVSYNIKINNRNITKKDIVHKIKKYSTFKIFNKYNDADITKDYFNTIYKVAENIKDNIIDIELDKKIIIDFINLSSYGNKIKKNNIDFANALPDKLKSLDIINMLDGIKKLIYYSYNQPVLDFINIFFNKIFIKSVYKDLLNYDDENIMYDGIFYDNFVKKIKAFDKQCEMLNEVLK